MTFGSKFDRWIEHMSSCAGKWSVDPIHNGEGKDLLLFHPNREDPTAGVYMWVYLTGSASAGTFTDALPHMGEATYTQRWSQMFDSYDDALARVIERVGMPLLLGIIGCS